MSVLQIAKFYGSSPAGASMDAADLSWYAVYTRANHEKSVVRQMELRSVEPFLPLYEKVSRWKDRLMKVQLPLFSGYVFVRMALEARQRVLEVPGVVRLIGFNGHPTPLANEEIQRLRGCLNGGIVPAEPCPYLRVGRRVRVKTGPLQGLEGILIKKKARYRVVISLQLIQRSVAVEVDAVDLETV